jgi:hypothetical protein
MSPLWAIPAVVSSIGVVGVYALARTAVEEARELAREVGRLGELRPALAAIRSEVGSARESLEARGRR